MSESEGMQYHNSKADTQLGVNESGDCWVYPSASSSGYVEIELPALPGSLNPTERLHARDFGVRVANQIESSMKGGYLKVGALPNAPTVLRHYLGAAQGSGLMDKGALQRMEGLASEFEATPYREEYYEQVLKPYLHSLTPKRRR